MKTMILVAAACLFLAGPLLANEFNIAQKKELEKITSNMVKFKDDTQKLELLTRKKDCAVKATDMDELKVCQTKFPPEQLQAMIK